MDWEHWSTAYTAARGAEAFDSFQSHFFPHILKPIYGMTDTDVTWFVRALTHSDQKWFVAFVFAYLPLPATLYTPMIDAAVDEPNPSFNRHFIEPCVRHFGHRCVNETLLDIVQMGTNVQKAGAANALYWARIGLSFYGNVPAYTEAFATPQSRTAYHALDDVWLRKRELFLAEFVTNADVQVRRSLIPALDLNPHAYREPLRPLIATAMHIARTHEDAYIRHRVEVQLGTAQLLQPLPHRD